MTRIEHFTIAVLYELRDGNPVFNTRPEAVHRVEIEGRRIGPVVSKIEAEIIVEWLREAWPELEALR